MSGRGINNSLSQVQGNNGSYVIVITRWNEKIVNGLLAGAMHALDKTGISCEQVQVVRVPGAFEIPLACQVVASRSDCDAVIALGAVIRGDTPHFEYVAGECVRGIGEVALGTGKPIAFGVLTVDTSEQALDRAGENEENKGAEAAMSAVEMVSLIRSLRD